jgi:hypothetical protein
MTNRKMIDYRVRIQVAEDSPDGVLLDFLKHERHPSFSHKEMVLWALRGYWMAIAFRQRKDEGNDLVTDTQMQRIVADALHQMAQQINYIQSTFGIEGVVSKKSFNNSEVTLPISISEASLRIDRAMRKRTKLSSKKSRKINISRTDVVTAEDKIETWYEGDDLFDSSI